MGVRAVQGGKGCISLLIAVTFGCAVCVFVCKCAIYLKLFVADVVCVLHVYALVSSELRKNAARSDGRL